MRGDQPEYVGRQLGRIRLSPWRHRVELPGGTDDLVAVVDDPLPKRGIRRAGAGVRPDVTGSRDQAIRKDASLNRIIASNEKEDT